MSEPGPELPGPPQPEDDARARWLRRAWIAVGVGWVTVICVGALLFFHIRDLEQAARESATTAVRPGVQRAAKPEPLDDAPLTPKPPPSKTPVAETPVAETPVAETPVAETPPQPEITHDDDIRQHISLTMNRNVRQLQACYAVELATAPDFGGTFTLDFSIQRDGTPHLVKITGDALPPTLERCMVDAVMGFRFSPIAKESPVRYPLVFRPGT